jgi:hypothetical protein
VVLQVTIQANPETQGFNFAWTGPNGFSSTDENPVVTVAGTYNLIVTDPSSNCSSSFSTTVAQLTAPTISINLPDFTLDCNTASILLDPSAVCSLPNVTCKLNGQVITGPILIGQPGTYLVEVFDNLSGCLMGSDMFQVIGDTAPPSLTITGDTDLPCAGGLTILTASSNDSNASFLWSNFGSGAVQTVPAGTYTVVATSANGCTTIATVQVTAPPVLVLEGVGTIDCDGSFNPTFEASGGTAPYTFTYTPQPPYPPGTTYSVSVTDANGCSTNVTGTVNIPTPPEFGISGTNESVLGANDGTATANFENGIPPFTYLWSNGETTQTVTNLAPGVYSCTITEANGCSVVGTVTIQPGVNATTDLPGLRRIALSPNPSSGRFELALALENPLSVQVELLDLTGRILYHTNTDNVLEKTWQFDLSTAPAGIYCCKIVAYGKVAVLKVVKN